MYTIDQAPKDLNPPFENTEHISTQMAVYIPKIVGNIENCSKCLGRRFINDNEKDIYSLIPCPICNSSGAIYTLSIPVWAWRSLYDGEIYLSGTTIAYLDKIKKEEMSK